MRINKLGRPGQGFRINNRLDIKDDIENKYREAVVIDIKQNFIWVKYNSQEEDEDPDAIDIDSGRISAVGAYSGAFGQARYPSEIVTEHSNEEYNTTHSNGNGIQNHDLSTSPISKVPQTFYQLIQQREALFAEKLALKNLHIMQVEGDGNCLFRSISHQLYGSENYHKNLRELTMNYITLEKEFFAQYIVGGMEAFTEYIARKRQDGVWGDDVEIEAMSEIYGISIVIFAYDNKPLRTFHEDVDTTKVREIKLSYHGRSHYNSIVEIMNYSGPIMKNVYGIYEDAVIAAVTNRNSRIANAVPTIPVVNPNPLEEEKKGIHEKSGATVAKARAAFEEIGSRDMEIALFESIQMMKEQEKSKKLYK